MATPEKPNKPEKSDTLDVGRRIALLEEASEGQARQIRALLEDNNRMSASIERLHGRLDEQKRWVRDEVAESLDGQQEWLDEAIARAEERIIARQGFDRIGRLRKEIEEGADFVFKELRRLREQAVGFSKNLKEMEDGFIKIVDFVEATDKYLKEFDEGWVVAGAVIDRTEKATSEIGRLLGRPARPEELRNPLVTSVEILEDMVASSQGRLTALERQFRDILNRFATGRQLPSSGEPPVVAAPANDPASAFPADGLVKVVMGEIGGKPCPVVDARDLHGFMKVETRFNDWIARRIAEYEFEENQDYVIGYSILSNQKKSLYGSEAKSGRGGDRRGKGYIISLEMAKELGMVERNPKGKEIRNYFIKCEERLHEILDRQAHPTSLISDSEPTDAMAGGEQDETLPVHYYTAADPVFMACIVLAEGTVTEEGDMGEWLSRRTFRPTNDMRMRNAKALAYLLRRVPRDGLGMRYTQYELALKADLTATHLRESLGFLEAVGLVSIQRLSKGRPGPTFELHLLWENIKAAAARGGVDLAGLGVLPAAQILPVGGGQGLPLTPPSQF